MSCLGISVISPPVCCSSQLPLQQPKTAYALLLFVIFLRLMFFCCFLFLTISVRPISKSTLRQISRVGRILVVDDQSEISFFSIQVMLP